jgi:hypothetical protein
MEIFAAAPPTAAEQPWVPGRLVRTSADAAQRDRVLNELRTRTVAGKPVATSRELTLSPGMGDVLDFRPPEAPPPAADGKAAETPASDAAGGAPAPPAEPPAIPVDRGLLCRLHEVEEEHGRETTREFWFDLRPLPSEEIVEAQAIMDPLGNLLTVKLSPRWDSGAPCPVAGGVTCQLHTSRGDEFDGQHIVRQVTTLDDRLRLGELQMRITREELAQLSEPLRVYVTVNESRGEFIYEIADADFVGPEHEKPNLRPDGNFLHLRQLRATTGEEPPATLSRLGSWWALKPPDRIEFELLGDVDDGASDECHVQLQVKRDTWGSPQVLGKFFMDRLTDYSARISPETGHLELRAAIRDHQFAWSPNERVGGTYEVTAQLVFADDQRDTRDQADTSLRHELRLDGQAPDPLAERWIVEGNGKGRFIEIKENVDAELEIRTADLTGTQVVKVYLDRDNLLPIGETDIDLGNAEPTETGEVWIYRLKTADMVAAKQLQFGENRFYLVVSDRLGNQTPADRPIGPLTVTVVPLTPVEQAEIMEAATPKQNVAVSVVRLNALKEEIPVSDQPKVLAADGTEVQAEIRPTEPGSFQIRDLPVGEYTIAADSSHRTPTGKTIKLHAEKKIEVKADKPPDPVKLVLEEVKDDEEKKGDG